MIRNSHGVRGNDPRHLWNVAVEDGLENLRSVCEALGGEDTAISGEGSGHVGGVPVDSIPARSVEEFDVESIQPEFLVVGLRIAAVPLANERSEEHTSELQSL